METIYKIAQTAISQTPKRVQILTTIQSIISDVGDQILQEYLKKWLVDTYFIKHATYNNNLEFQVICQHYLDILPNALTTSLFLKNFFRNPYTYYEVLHIEQIVGFSLLFNLYQRLNSDNPIFLQSCNVKIHTERAYNNAFTSSLLVQAQNLYNEIANQEDEDEEHMEERMKLQKSLNEHYILKATNSQILNELLQFNDLRIKIPRESSPGFYDDKLLYRTNDNKVVYQTEVRFEDYERIESLYVANLTEEIFSEFKLELLSQDAVKHFSASKACIKLTLQNLTYLKSMTLRYVKIDNNVLFQILQFRKHLEQLNLFGNQIQITQQTESELLSQNYDQYKIQSLKYLNLGENDIQTIQFINKFFIKLQHLEIQRINLPSDFDQLVMLNDLRFINMADNKLETLKPLKLCTNLIYIDYSYNYIADIHYIADVKSLKYAYFSHNNIEFLHNFSKLIELIEIDISYNRLHNTQEILELQNLPNLLYLNYSYCSVNYECPNLKFVSQNAIIHHEELLAVDDENIPIECDPASVQSSQMLTNQ